MTAIELTYQDLQGARARSRAVTAEENEYLGGTFIGRELFGENEAVKQPQRARVADHLLTDHPDGKPMRLFSLPGIRWAFEHYLEQRRPGLQTYIACERNQAIFERMVSTMPGGTSRAFEEQLTHGPLYGYESSAARLVWAEAGTLLNLGRMEKGGTRSQQRWNLRFKRWTAAWLDFQGPLGAETMTAIRRVRWHLDVFREVIPVAVTILLGRESGETLRIMRAIERPEMSALDRRVALLRAVLNQNCSGWRFELSDSWQYESTGGAPMGMILGRMHRIGPPPLEAKTRVQWRRGFKSKTAPAQEPRILREGDIAVYKGEPVQVIGFEREKVRLLKREGRLARQLVVELRDLGA